MKSISVSCNNCGGNLQVLPETKYVTCNWCSSHLLVEHLADTTLTRVVEQLKEDQETLKRKLEIETLKGQLRDLEVIFQNRYGANAQRIQQLEDSNGGGDPAMGLYGLGFLVIFGVSFLAYFLQFPWNVVVWCVMGTLFLFVLQRVMTWEDDSVSIELSGRSRLLRRMEELKSKIRALEKPPAPAKPEK